MYSSLKEDPVFAGRCWIVWAAGNVNSYRCLNTWTAEEAVEEWVRRYGPLGTYDVVASLYREDGFVTLDMKPKHFRVVQQVKPL